MDLPHSLHKFSSAAVAQKWGSEANNNQLEGFLLTIFSSVLFCKPPFCSETVNFGASAPFSPTYLNLCQSWPEL